MKSSKLFTLFMTFGLFLLYTSCDNPAQKVGKAEENVVEAEQELQMAKEEYLADIEKYRLLSAEKIADNEKRIEEFNARLAKEKKSARADYKAKIEELEKKNTDMKMKMGTYKEDGKENWEKFKNEFGKDMDALGESIANFVKDDK